MAGPFDPNKFLAETAPKGGFDPNKFIAETAPPKPTAGDYASVFANTDPKELAQQYIAATGQPGAKPVNLPSEDQIVNQYTGEGGGITAAVPMTLKGLLSRTGEGAALGGIQGASQPAPDVMQRLKNSGMGALKGGGLALAAEPVAAGAGALGDELMTRAVGIKKAYPGTGRMLAKLGIGGTQNMMAQQVGQAFPKAEEELQNAVSSIPGTFPSADIADAIQKTRPSAALPSTGKIPAAQQPNVDKLNFLAQSARDMGANGQLTPADLLHQKRAMDWEGYTAANTPGSSLEAGANRAGANKARSMLDAASDGATRDALAKEQALVQAQNGLNAPDVYRKGFLNFSDLALANAAGVPGILASRAMGSPLVQSAVGRGALGASAALQSPSKEALLQLLNQPNSTQSQ